MNLPDEFVKQGLEMAEGSKLFGVSFADMTREELIASAAQGWNAERQQRESRMDESRNLSAHYLDIARDRYGLKI